MKSKSLGEDDADAVIFNSPFESKFNFGMIKASSVVSNVCSDF